MKSALTPDRRQFLTGTLLLTATGFFCRILGFFYRIFLSRAIGAEGLGLYHMVHPVFMIGFSLCAGAMQTALAQFIAANQEKGRRVFRIGLSFSLCFSMLLALFISMGSSFLAAHVLLEPRCAPYLKLIAWSIPFAALHACINGYYYGMQKTHVPAFSQAAEQLIRMAAVFAMIQAAEANGCRLTVSLAVWGHVVGEVAAAMFTVVCMRVIPPEGDGGWRTGGKRALADKTRPSSALAGPTRTSPASALLLLALPLMGSRLVINLLASAEAVWIPNRLTAFGLTNPQALSVYGVLTGMAMPFVLFPSTITNSIAVLLLPTVAKAQADNDQERIRSAIALSIRYSLLMGFFCTGVFQVFGRTLGNVVFQNASAGAYIRTLGWLCPFLYLATTTGSILNGLGKTHCTFVQTTCALLIRLTFVLFGIPQLGMKAYLWGILVSEGLLAAWHLITLFSLCSKNP